MAPTSTSTGRVALTGPTIVRGRCFIAKYPAIQEDSTKALFSRIYFCTAHPPNPVENRNGEKMAADRTVFRKRTGMTALPRSDTFFAES